MHVLWIFRPTVQDGHWIFSISKPFYESDFEFTYKIIIILSSLKVRYKQIEIFKGLKVGLKLINYFCIKSCLKKLLNLTNNMRWEKGQLRSASVCSFVKLHILYMQNDYEIRNTAFCHNTPLLSGNNECKTKIMNAWPLWASICSLLWTPDFIVFHGFSSTLNRWTSSQMLPGHLSQTSEIFRFLLPFWVCLYFALNSISDCVGSAS